MAVGYRDKNDNNENCDLDTGKYRVYSYTYTNSNWQAQNEGTELTANGFTNTGTKDDDVQQPLAVAAVAADGAMTKEYLFISGSMYQLSSDSTGPVGDTSYGKNRGIGGYIINNTGILDYAVGNFDGNQQGREQVYYVEYHKQETFDKEFLRLGQLYKSASQTGTSEDGEPIYTSAGNFSRWTDGWTYYGKKNCNVAITAADVNNDAVLAKIEEISYGYNEPKVMAILEASPHFSELNDGDIGNSATSLGQSKSESTSTESHGSFGFDVMAGFEYVAPIVETGGGIEFNTSHTFTFGDLAEKEQEVSITRSNDSTENMVVMYATPMTYYKYRVKNPDGSEQAESTMYLAVAGKPSTNMITVEEYNQAAASYNMDLIGEGVLGDPGKPNTYRGNLPNASNEHSWEYGGDNDWVSYGASDTSTTTTQSITDSEGTGKSFNYEYEGSVQAYAIAAGFKAGGGVHWGAGTSKETMSTESVTKEGAVTGGGNKDYDFNWKFATWTTHLNGDEVPILGYLVRGVKAPPSPAQDLVLSEQTTNSMKLEWSEGDRPADYYKIWRKTREGTGDHYGLVTRVSAATDGSYEYTLTGLAPNEEYEYVITSGSYTTGLESVYSESVVGRTLSAELTRPEITISGDASGELGESVTLTVNTVLYSYKNQTLQWQERLAGDRWRNIDGATSKKYTIDITTDRIGAKYRCVVTAQTSAADRVPFYSDPVELKVGALNASVGMTITGATGGNGTENDPYVGQSDYDTVTRNTTQENVTRADTVNYGEDTLVVYQTGNDQYVGIKNAGSNTAKYYALTKNNDGTYTVGAELKLSEATTYKYNDGTAAELPTDSDDPEQPTKHLMEIPGQTDEGIETIKVDLSATGDAPTDYITKGFAYLDGVIYNTSSGEKITTDTDKYYQLYGTKNSGSGADDTFFVSQTKQVATGDTDNDSVSYDTEVHYYIITLTVDASGTDKKVTGIERREITPTTTQTLSGTGFTDVTDPTFTAVQTTTKENVTTESRKATNGTDITLNIATTRTKSGQTVALGNVPYTVTIVNTTTGAVSTLSGTTGADGKAAPVWRAPVSGLYAITTATASGETVKSDTLYYLAGIREVVTTDTAAPTETVYTLNAPITMTYGKSASISLFKQEMSKSGDTISADKTEVTNKVAFTARLVGETVERDITTTFAPTTAGSYVITAYRNKGTNTEEKLASTTVTVERANLTLRPVWGEGNRCDPNSAPTTLSGITVNAVRGLIGSDEGLLDAVTVSCGLYKDDGRRNDALSGRYDVTLSVDTSKTSAAQLLKKYNITMESGMLIQVQNTGTVIYKAGENGTLDARYNADAQQQFESGASIPIGDELSFTAMPTNTGYKVGEWKVNGKTLAEFDPTGTRYTKTATKAGGEMLVIGAFATGDIDTTTKALTVEVSFSSAAHTITYSVESSTGGELTAESNSQKVTSGQTVADGASITFTAAPENGKAVAYWTVDNEIYKWPGTENPYRENTLTLTDVKKAHTVSVVFKNAQSSTVTANVETETGVSETSLTLSAKRGEETVDLTKANNAPIGSVINFTLSGTGLDTNITVKEWKVDGVTATGSGGKDSFDLYVTKSAHTVTAVVAVAQHYTVSFADTKVGEITTAAVTAKSNGKAIKSGESIAAYLPIEFTAALHENYYVTGWTGAQMNEDDHNKATISSLSGNANVSVQTAEKPVVTVNTPTAGQGTITVTGTRTGATKAVELTGAENENGHVDKDSTITITAAPTDNYYVTKITVGGQDYPYDQGTGSVTLKNVTITESTTVTATFVEKPQVTITNFDSDKGSYSVVGTRSGSEVKLTDATVVANFNSHVDNKSKVTITATPKEGYYVKSIKTVADNVSTTLMEETSIGTYQSGIVTREISSITKDTAIAIEYAAKPTVTITSNGNVTITANQGEKKLTSSQWVEKYSGAIEFTAEPATGYEIDTWNVQGWRKVDDAANDNTAYTQGGPITENVTVNVTTKQIPQYDLALSVKELGGTTNGGTISANISRKALPNYNATIAETGKFFRDSNIDIVPKPESGYRVQSYTWSVKNEKSGKMESGSGETIPANLLNNVQGDVQIEVCYVKLGSGISFGPLEGGTGSENGYISAAKMTENDSSVMDKADGLQLTTGGVSFTATPSAGYEVEGWFKTTGSKDELISGTEGKTEFIFTPADYDTIVYIHPKFRQVEYQITTADGVTVSPALTNGKARGGTELEFTAPSKAGQNVTGWTINGKPYAGTNTLTWTVENGYLNGESVDTYHVEPVYANGEYTVSYSDPANGKLTATVGNNTQVFGNTEVTFTVEPNEHYEVDHWTVDGTPSTEKSNKLTVNITDNTEVAVVLKLKTYSVELNQAAEGGKAEASSNAATVTALTDITFTATPDTGWYFAGWKITGSEMSNSSDNPLTLKITGNTTVEPVFTKQMVAITATLADQSKEGTIAMTAGDEAVPANGKVPYGSTVRVTVTPKNADDMVESWKVGNDVKSQMTNDADAPLFYDVTVMETTNVVVKLIDRPEYTVTIRATGNGTANIDGKGTVTVKRGENITATAVVNNTSNYLKHWLVNGTVTQKNGSTLDIGPIRQQTEIVAVFDELVRQKVMFENVTEMTGSTSTVSITADGKPINPGKDDAHAEQVVGQSKIVFTANILDDAKEMIGEWTIDGKKQENLSKILTIDSLDKDTKVTVKFVSYEGYAIPTGGTGYTVTGITRTPDDTQPNTQIRKNGTVTFTVKPESGYYMTTLKVNGTDCLSKTGTNAETDKLTVVNNGDGSYTITVTNVTKTIDLHATAMELRTETKELTLPEELKDKYTTVDALKTALRTHISSSVSTSNIAYLNVELQYKSGDKWVKVTDPSMFPKGGLDVTIPYSTLSTTTTLDSSYSYSVVHMFLTNMNSQTVGDTETLAATAGANGITFHVNSLSPFAIGWYKYTGGGGGGGGGGGAVSTYTLTFDTNGGSAIDKITKDSGTTIDLAAYKPTRAGYTFAGWFSDKALTKAVTSVKLTANTTVYAKWTQDGGTVQNPFVDVKKGAYYYDAVLWAVDQKITSGTSATTFSPDASCTRAQMVTFLWRAAGSPKAENTKNPFTDVKADAYYYDAVLWAVEKGVTSGTSATTFSPDATVTRGQTVTFLYRNAGSPDVTGTMPFTDVEADAYYAKAVLWAVQQKITTGTSETTFSPANDCTRGQIVTFLYRAE